MTRIAIVAGSFHREQVSRMIAAAEAEAAGLGVEISQIVWVPGSMEKPLAVKRLLREGKADALVVLGIIERGETAHGRVMGDAVIGALIDLQLEYMTPIGVGILGPEILPDQIEARLEPYAVSALKAACHMLAIAKA